MIDTEAVLKATILTLREEKEALLKTVYDLRRELFWCEDRNRRLEEGLVAYYAC